MIAFETIELVDERTFPETCNLHRHVRRAHRASNERRSSRAVCWRYKTRFGDVPTKESIELLAIDKVTDDMARGLASRFGALVEVLKAPGSPMAIVPQSDYLSSTPFTQLHSVYTAKQA